MIQDFQAPRQSANGQAVGDSCHIGDFPPSPWQYPTYIPPVTVGYFRHDNTPTYPLQVRKVENGFIILKNGFEFVFGDTKELLKFLEGEFNAMK